MCLSCKWPNRKKIAKQDIECFKFLQKGNNIFATPFVYMRVEIGKTYVSKLNSYKSRYVWYIIPKRQVDLGLHSFATLKGAKESGSTSYI